MMKRIEDLEAYEVIDKHEIDELKSMSYLLKHKKTGARIALLSNDDENKVFYIDDFGFKEVPKFLEKKKKINFDKERG